MSDELARLLDLPAAARLGIADGELALTTLRHEHADKIIIERQRLGVSIDLAELLRVIGAHGLADVPQLRVSEVATRQLPAPIEEAPAPVPRARRTTRHLKTVTCSKCSRTFKNAHAMQVHQGFAHKEAPADVPEPAAAAPAPATVSEYLCSTCGLSLELHERCRDCQGLLGPEHDAGMAVGTFDERPLCATCVSYRATAPGLGIAA